MLDWNRCVALEGPFASLCPSSQVGRFSWNSLLRPTPDVHQYFMEGRKPGEVLHVQIRRDRRSSLRPGTLWRAGFASQVFQDSCLCAPYRPLCTGTGPSRPCVQSTNITLVSIMKNAWLDAQRTLKCIIITISIFFYARCSHGLSLQTRCFPEDDHQLNILLLGRSTRG